MCISLLPVGATAAIIIKEMSSACIAQFALYGKVCTQDWDGKLKEIILQFLSNLSYLNG